ncbi:MAG TPA: DNA polymerase III subunit gamma/tau [Candidatus Paceibacterota bacterium]|nr:DNA polymerase III subunit gamma/tau [Candidatus Paceibacterota bacterium]
MTNKPAPDKIETLSLYRKYRPADWSEVRGQEHVVKVLEGSVANGKIAHAYLFAGSRGTGKTSVARILAKALGTSANDIYEMDAASNRGVDDIRELRESILTLPFESKYKVYIIDEVHMLTKEAWAALLKTLEEPPAHAIFILATTERAKVPDTIQSRSQVFEFKKPTPVMLEEMISEVAAKEGKTLPPESAHLISLLGDGSFRDTYSILQKAISYSKDKKIDPEEVILVTGAPSNVLMRQMLEGIEKRDIGLLSTTLREAEKNGADIMIFMKMLLNKLRTAMLMRYAVGERKQIALDVGADESEHLAKFEKGAGKTLNSALLIELLEASLRINESPIKTLPIELAFIKAFGEEK